MLALAMGLLGGRSGKLILYAGMALAIAAAVGGAVLWHKAKVRAFGNERFAAGETLERGKWQAELSRLKEEHARARRADELTIRDIAIRRSDERARARDEQESFDRAIGEVEEEDAKSGSAPNPFDPRVLQRIR